MNRERSIGKDLGETNWDRHGVELRACLSNQVVICISHRVPRIPIPQEEEIR